VPPSNTIVPVVSADDPRYVRPDSRGFGVGRALAIAVIDAARDRGYRQMRLDTLAGMDDAQGLYRTLGFREIAAYYENPVPGTRYLELDLRSLK
jgi:ribosomal protein S18 acetylase RimI-like enzyme